MQGIHEGFGITKRFGRDTRDNMVLPEVVTSLDNAHLLIKVTFDGICDKRIAVKHADHNAFPNAKNRHISANLIDVRNRNIAILPLSLVERARSFDFHQAIRAVRLAHHTVNVGRDIRLSRHGIDVGIGDDIVVRIPFRQPSVYILLRDMTPQLIQPGLRSFFFRDNRLLSSLGVEQIKIRLEFVCAKDSGNVRTAQMVCTPCLPLVLRQGACIDLDFRAIIAVRVTEFNCFRACLGHCLIVEFPGVGSIDFPVREMLRTSRTGFVSTIIACHWLFLLSKSAAQAIHKYSYNQQDKYIFRFYHYSSSLPGISTSLQRVRAQRATQSAAAKIFLAS